jgi:cell division septum initiation protein DivIVA
MTERSGGMALPPRWAAAEQRPARRAPEHAAMESGPDKAMEVLVIAQRTAEEHLRATRAEADNIRAEALASAAEIVRDAETMAQDIRRKADHALAEATATAESITAQAQDHAAEVERSTVAMLAEARNRADQMAADARRNVEEMRRQAQEEYDSVLDRLQASRESLLLQIESLEQFDRDFRQRLLDFMQGHMRALLGDDGPAPAHRAEYPAA